MEATHVKLRPKIFGQTYFEYKKYDTVSTRFLFIQNVFAQRLLVQTVLKYLQCISHVYNLPLNKF